MGATGDHTSLWERVSAREEALKPPLKPPSTTPIQTPALYSFNTSNRARFNASPSACPLNP